MPVAVAKEKQFASSPPPPAAETAPVPVMEVIENRVSAPEIDEPLQPAPASATGTRVADAEGMPAGSAPPTEIAATPPPAPAAGKDAETAPSAPAPPPEPGYESRATYYAKRFNGRRTITDEIYDPNLLTAATHELPLGALARVINPKNGREVVVRVNDRPRKRNFPLIDLSRAAAKKLGFLGKGVIKVRVIPLPPDAPEYLTAGKKKKKK